MWGKATPKDKKKWALVHLKEEVFCKLEMRGKETERGSRRLGDRRKGGAN
ncbi:hypothetical protein LINPERPRIM_LOCUS14783 [Linum perenne]